MKTWYTKCNKLSPKLGTELGEFTHTHTHIYTRAHTHTLSLLGINENMPVKKVSCYWCYASSTWIRALWLLTLFRSVDEYNIIVCIGLSFIFLYYYCVQIIESIRKVGEFCPLHRDYTNTKLFLNFSLSALHLLK